MKIYPYLNSALASLYIFTISGIQHYLQSNFSNTPDTILAPIIVLSLLVISVAIMGFLFFYFPISFIIEGRRSDAIKFFFKTVISFFLLMMTSLLLISAII